MSEPALLGDEPIRGEAWPDWPIIERLLASDEPAIQYKTRVHVLGEDLRSERIRALWEEIRESPRVCALLSERDTLGRIPLHPYQKWCGAHWVLAQLADLGYPPGDTALIPLRDQVLEWLFPLDGKSGGRVPVIRGLARRCASQEGNALLAMLRLEIANERADDLAEALIRWQWPDGGWNCDRTPEAATSSFHESLIPMRALHCYGTIRGESSALAAARRVAEFFLARRLYRRRSTGAMIHPTFGLLHYPYYWQYTILHGLRAIGEMALLEDRRCADALDLLESKRLSGGGFPAENRFYRPYRGGDRRPSSNVSNVSWGGAAKRRANEWITAEALAVLHDAGRLSVA